MSKKRYPRETFKNVDEHKLEPVEEQVDVIEEAPEEVLEEPQKITIGVVTNCTKLNVREAPNKDSSIICTIDCLTEVMIDDEESTDDFYKVCIASGTEGFCMKNFISIRH